MFEVLNGESIFSQVKKPGAVIVIPVNGFIKHSGHAVMGRGTALAAREKYPGIDLAWGQELERQGRMRGNLGRFKTEGAGNHVSVIHSDPTIVAFPTQWHFKYPAETALIDRSFCELTKMADVKGWQQIYLPKFGILDGVSDWEHDVLPFMRDYLDERFILCM